MASLGQIAEAAGVRPPNSSRSTRNCTQTPGAAAGIASGRATGSAPRVLEPAPITGSASSSSTVGLAAPAGLAERSASATDLYQRAIRDAELSGRPQQRESDPVFPIARSTSTPPDERSSEPVPQQKPRQEQSRSSNQQDQSQAYVASAYLNPPQVRLGQASRLGPQASEGSRQDNDSSGHGSDPSPISNPSSASHASTSIIPEHHRLYPYAPGPYGHTAQYTPNSAGHFSASSSPVYLQQQHHQPHQQHTTYAYHTQYYAPQYHYPPPSDSQQQPYYTIAHPASPHSPVQDIRPTMTPQTFYPPTYYFPTGQVLHTGSSSPNSAIALALEDGGESNHAMSDGLNNAQASPFPAQSGQQSYQPVSQQHHQGHTQQGQRLPAGISYQFPPQSGMQPYMPYGSSHNQGNQLLGHNAVPTSSHLHQSLRGPSMPPMMNQTYAYPLPGSQRSSIDMSQNQYRPVHLAPLGPQSFIPASGDGGKHARYPTADTAFSDSTPYSNMDHPGHAPHAQYNSRITPKGRIQPAPKELARGHLAQSKFREALGAYDPNAQLPISANERNRAADGDSRLPKPPAHSPWAMWVGNVPSDATHSELWRFFSSRPPPGNPIPDSIEETETLESEATHLSADQPRPDYNTVGIDSIHLISRSNCCFVNMASKRHLDHAIKVSHGLSLRPHDPRCKPLVCRVRKNEDDNKTGVGAQRGKGIHKAWVAEKDKAKASKPSEPDDISSALVSPLGVSSSTQSRIQPTRHGSASTSYSASTTSTTSSFLHRHFPKRYFILKSHSEDDLHLSVERGLWATQSHNEPVLDQAFKTAQSVFLIFGANKSGEFFGYAKMAGPIDEDKVTPRGSYRGVDGTVFNPSSGSKSSTSAARKPEPSILETPEEETGDNEQGSSGLNVPPMPSVLSPSGVVSNSPQPISNTTTPASPPRRKIADPGVDYLNVKHVQHNTAPSPMLGEKEIPGTRNASSLDPVILANLAKMGVRDEGLALDNRPWSPAGMAKAEKTANAQLLAGASSRPGLNDHGVLRKDTVLTPHERNARLEFLEAETSAAVDGAGARSLEESMEQGISKPFKIEWIRVQKLPFYRTRHLRNTFNGNREVKISRDGTEIEPDVGQQLLELFWKDPELQTAQQNPTLTNSKSVTSPLLA